MALSLVPDALAQPGYRFHFAGPNDGDECQGCPVKTLCFRLAPGRTYEVRALRDVKHPCRLHDEDRVRVVEVEEAPLHTSAETRHLRGTALVWSPVDCGMPECPRYGFCHPVGPVAGSRYEVASEGAAMDCPAGFELREVGLRALDG